MNCGWERAVEAIRWYVSSGMTAHIDLELLAWRSRQSISISLEGKVRTLSRSR